MRNEQIKKILVVLMVATAIMLVCEIVFSIDAVNSFFSNIITNSSDGLVFAIIWLVMFLQVTILNIPAYVVLSACLSIKIDVLSWQFILIVLSAYMCGCVLAYFIGRCWGIKAVKWCAGSDEDFNKWSSVLNNKGKWYYLATVIFPLFPDDLLCIVAGSVKLNFTFYFFSNLIGRGIGLLTMLLTLNGLDKINTGSFPLMVVVWAVALILELIAYVVVKNKKSSIEN